MIRFLFKLILLAVVGILVWSLVRGQGRGSAGTVLDAERVAKLWNSGQGVSEIPRRASEGPAERVGEIIDDALRDAGEAAERAGRSLQSFTDNASPDSAPTPMKLPHSLSGKQNKASQTKETTTARPGTKLRGIERDLESSPTASPAPPEIEEF